MIYERSMALCMICWLYTKWDFILVSKCRKKVLEGASISENVPAELDRRKWEISREKKYVSSYTMRVSIGLSNTGIWIKLTVYSQIKNGVFALFYNLENS